MLIELNGHYGNQSFFFRFAWNTKRSGEINIFVCRYEILITNHFSYMIEQRREAYDLESISAYKKPFKLICWCFGFKKNTKQAIIQHEYEKLKVDFNTTYKHCVLKLWSIYRTVKNTLIGRKD